MSASQPGDPVSAVDAVTKSGVFEAVRDGYDAVYGALPSGETFERIWRTSAYRGEFPAEYAHIGFLTLTEARRMLGLVDVGPGDVLVDVACGAGGPGLWAARQTGASLIGIDPSSAGLAAGQERVYSAFRALVDASDALTTEMGQRAAASALAEAMLTVRIKPYRRRILICATRPD